jgi:hypothetical protein
MQTEIQTTVSFGTTRDGVPVTAKVRDRSYTPEARAALKPEIWQNAGIVIGELIDGASVHIFAMPTVVKVAEYGGKRWAWLHLAGGVSIKVYENSARATALGLQFDAGKYRPAVIANEAVVVIGTVRQLGTGWTIASPWIVPPADRNELQAEKAAEVQMAFTTAYAQALDGLQVFAEEDVEADDGLDA